MKSLLALIALSTTIGLACPAYANGGGAPPGQPGGPGGGGPTADVSSEAAQAFLSALRREGISYARADQVVATADAVCKMAAEGKPDSDAVNTLQNSNPQLTEADARKFVTIAKTSYCPPEPAPADTANG